MEKVEIYFVAVREDDDDEFYATVTCSSYEEAVDWAKKEITDGYREVFIFEGVMKAKVMLPCEPIVTKF